MAVEHVDIADADRHENKGADAATAGTYNRANGDGTTSYVPIDYTDLSGTPTLGTAAASAVTDFATAAQGAKADDALPLAGGTLTGPLKLLQATLAALPNVTTYNRFLVVVTDATAGPALCISNGTNWIDIRTNVTVV